MTRVYLFSVTNPLEVEGGGKPHLDQVGPFTYSEQVERVGEGFRADGSVSYETRRTWHHLPGQSLPLDTPVTSLDVPMLAAAEAARGDWWMVSGQPSLGTLPNRALLSGVWTEQPPDHPHLPVHQCDRWPAPV